MNRRSFLTLTAVGLGALAGCQTPNNKTKTPPSSTTETGTEQSTATPSGTPTSEHSVNGMGFQGTFRLTSDEPYKAVHFEPPNVAQYDIELHISEPAVGSGSTTTVDACILNQVDYERYKKAVTEKSSEEPLGVDPIVCEKVGEPTTLEGQVNPGHYVLVIDGTGLLGSESELETGQKVAVRGRGTVDWSQRA